MGWESNVGLASRLGAGGGNESREGCYVRLSFPSARMSVVDLSSIYGSFQEHQPGLKSIATEHSVMGPAPFSKEDGAAYALGVDIGGTFTDFILLDRKGAPPETKKSLTTLDDPSKGVLRGVSELLDDRAIPPADVLVMIHATTLATNCIIERDGAKTGLITTAGFRDVLEMGFETRYDMYDLGIDLPSPLVPRDLRQEVSERINASGEVLEPLDILGLRESLERLVSAGVTSVAVCLLHAYANPVHEQAVGEILETEFPKLFFSLSHAVQPEIREFERVSTTVANAYVQPRVKSYLQALQTGLRELGISSPLHIMLSSGGITTVDAAVAQPVRILESGPAAGVEAARAFGASIGYQNVISFDMGGTTAKIALVDRGTVSISNYFETARLHRFKRGSGLPIKSPTIELIEIGAGGGSLVWIDQHGLLKVGPQSAGSDPGPACYGLGGEQATVTDADLILGYLGKDGFSSYGLTLDLGLAEKALGHLADQLGMSVTEAAWGVHEIVNENMATAARIHLVEKGKDPAELSVIAFGGAGPVHAYGLMEKLGARTLVVPRVAGVLSALGLLLADPAADLVRTHVSRLDDVEWDVINSLFDSMRTEAMGYLPDTNDDDIEVGRSADMRYLGQGSEIRVLLPEGVLNANRTEEIRQAFFNAYDELFGRHLEDVPVEVISWRTRVTAIGHHQSLELDGKRSRKLPKPVYREVFFSQIGGFSRVPVYEHKHLSLDSHLRGPAIVEAAESATVIAPGLACSVDQNQNLLVSSEIPAS